MSDFQIPTPLDPITLQSPKLQQALNGAPERVDDLEAAAKDFESVLLHQLMQEMSRTISDSGLTGGSGASKQIQGIFWSFLAEEVADNGGLGLWQDIQRNMQGDMQGNMQGDMQGNMQRYADSSKVDPPASTVEQEL